jgi:hypothetical protein
LALVERESQELQQGMPVIIRYFQRLHQLAGLAARFIEGEQAQLVDLAAAVQTVRRLD